MATWSSSDLRAGEQVGRDAFSRRSKRSLRVAIASETFFMKRACSATPGVLKVLGMHPGARIR